MDLFDPGDVLCRDDHGLTFTLVHERAPQLHNATMNNDIDAPFPMLLGEPVPISCTLLQAFRG